LADSRKDANAVLDFIKIGEVLDQLTYYQLLKKYSTEMGFTALNGVIFVNKELERMWKGAIVAYFKTRTQHLPVGSEENYKSSRRCQGRDSKQKPPEYEARIVRTYPGIPC
jgi:hypothetical protein